MTWRYFSYETDPMLACPCCGEQGMDDDFMRLLDDLRQTCGFPWIVTSGYRCPVYNRSLSKAGTDDGPHTRGRAVDVNANSRQRYLIQRASMARGMTRFGIGSDFIHIDNLTEADGADEQVVWPYLGTN